MAMPHSRTLTEPATDPVQHIVNTAELRRTADVYAQGADRRDKQAWRSIMTTDIIIEGPGFRTVGLEANLASLDVLARMFRATVHRVANQVVTVSGDEAAGETYCVAEHLLADVDELLVWSIRYQDRWRRDEGAWRFYHRQLIVDWQETRPATVMER